MTPKSFVPYAAPLRANYGLTLDCATVADDVYQAACRLEEARAYWLDCADSFLSPDWEPGDTSERARGWA